MCKGYFGICCGNEVWSSYGQSAQGFGVRGMELTGDLLVCRPRKVILWVLTLYKVGYSWYKWIMPYALKQFLYLEGVLRGNYVGYYVTLLSEMDSSWLIYRHIWNIKTILLNFFISRASISFSGRTLLCESWMFREHLKVVDLCKDEWSSFVAVIRIYRTKDSTFNSSLGLNKLRTRPVKLAQSLWHGHFGRVQNF